MMSHSIYQQRHVLLHPVMFTVECILVLLRFNRIVNQNIHEFELGIIA